MPAIKLNLQGRESWGYVGKDINSQDQAPPVVQCLAEWWLSGKVAEFFGELPSMFMNVIQTKQLSSIEVVWHHGFSLFCHSSFSVYFQVRLSGQELCWFSHITVFGEFHSSVLLLVRDLTCCSVLLCRPMLTCVCLAKRLETTHCRLDHIVGRPKPSYLLCVEIRKLGSTHACVRIRIGRK